MKPVTIDDVARSSGVSVATVSRAVRGLPNVSPGTRQRVLEVVAELRYRADPNASRLATGKTGVVVMAVPSISSWYTAQAMSGVEAVLAATGLEMSVALLSDPETRQRALGEPQWLAKRADGLILLDLSLSMAGYDFASSFPVVLVGNESGDVDSVSIDNTRGGAMAGAHLLELGHRCIAVIAGSTHDTPTAITARRTDGLQNTLTAAGLDVAGTSFGNYSALGGYEAMLELLSREPRPTAVFALSDEMAMGAMRAVADAGLDVPGDISMIGFDDHDLAFACGLTTVAQDPADLGTSGAHMLVERLGGHQGPPRALEGSLDLKIRGSTAKT